MGNCPCGEGPKEMGGEDIFDKLLNSKLHKFSEDILIHTKFEGESQKMIFIDNNDNNNIFGSSSNKNFVNKEEKITKVNASNFMIIKLRNVDNNGDEEEFVNKLYFDLNNF